LWRCLSADNWPGLNVSRYNNPRCEEVFKQAKQMPLGAERDALYCEASVLINHDAVHLWMFAKNDVRVWREDIKGYVYNPVDAIREYRYYDLYRETE
jgi:ABC-type transport system substrate-binding protein